MQKTQEDRHCIPVESSRAFVPPWSYLIIILGSLLLSDQHLQTLLQIGTLEAILNFLYGLNYLFVSPSSVLIATFIVN